jgi:hypothetical protein
MKQGEREREAVTAVVCLSLFSLGLLCRLLFIFPSRIESEKGASLSLDSNKNIFTERVVILFSPECGTFSFIFRERERFLFLLLVFSELVHPSRWNRLRAIYYYDTPRFEM